MIQNYGLGGLLARIARAIQPYDNPFESMGALEEASAIERDY